MLSFSPGLREIYSSILRTARNVDSLRRERRLTRWSKVYCIHCILLIAVQCAARIECSWPTLSSRATHKDNVSTGVKYSKLHVSEPRRGISYDSSQGRSALPCAVCIVNEGDLTLGEGCVEELELVDCQLAVCMPRRHKIISPNVKRLGVVDTRLRRGKCPHRCPIQPESACWRS
jgi:hypothetical protein